MKRSRNTALSGLIGIALLAATPLAQAGDEVAGLCKRVSDKLSSVSLQECEAARLDASGHYSAQSVPIAVREYPPVGRRKPQARVLLMGGIHGDEYSSVSVVFKWMQALNQHHSGLFHWHVAPIVNPDGMLRRRAQRMNANGVDLNRNFPTPMWEKLSQDYWVKRTKRNPRRYPGTAAGSEPETRWMIEEINQFRPDVIVQVHAPFGIIDFDGDKHPPKQLGRLRLRLLGTYPGSLGNYGIQKDIPVLTIELPSAGSMPTDAEIDRIWTDLVTWLKQHISDDQNRLITGEPADAVRG